MKKKTVIFCFALCLFVCAGYTSLYKTTGSHPGSTGAPLDQTCAQSGCHTDAAVILNAVNNNTLVFSSADSTYIPNQSYTINVQVKGNPASPTSKFGFELVAIRDVDSMNVGMFTITEMSRTQLINHVEGSDTRYSVSHQASGTPATATNFDQWTVTWTAPIFNAGGITFYYATNCTNNDGLVTGDRIYLHSFKIKPSPLLSVKEYGDEYESKVFYNKNAREIQVNYKLRTQKQMNIVVYDDLGKEILKTPTSLKAKGIQSEKISLSENVKAGVYLVNLEIGSNTIAKKVIVD